MTDNADTAKRLEEIRRENDGLLVDGESARDHIVGRIYDRAGQVADKAVKRPSADRPPGARGWTARLDDVLTSPRWGMLTMALLLAAVFWITIIGANYPSSMLATWFFRLEAWLTATTLGAGVPAWLHGVLVLGVYRGLAWVVSVMLPPMAIFFPLFTLLEDFGYLPRVAFNLDKLFRRAGAHGKQSLTMCMGFGCNAAGVIACRVIDSPRERLIAIITNNFVPCNGRFPTLIALSAIFFGRAGAGGNALLGALLATAMVMGLVLVGVLVTLLVSGTLSRTVLRGIPSAFVLELPPYRPPQVLRVVIRSIFDRTLFVLWRAVLVAAPAGAIVWILGNVFVGGDSLLGHFSAGLEPLGWLLGMDGFILAAFILGLPANEIVVPILLMAYLGRGAMLELDSLAALRGVLLHNGWTWLTALCTMLFSVLHFPCGTTLLTILKETGSRKWTALSALIPTGIAIAVCAVVALIGRLLMAVT